MKSVQSEVVYEGDSFVYRQGISPQLEHVPGAGDRGKATHVWAAIETVSGGWIFRVMTASDIEQHRAQYSQSRGGPWVTAWSEMACKTVLKMTLKRCPVSTEVQRAIELDDRGELGMPVEIDVTPQAEEPAEEKGAA